MDARPGGPVVKTSAQPARAGDQSEDDLSAVGAALNLGPLPPMSLGAYPDFLLHVRGKQPRRYLLLTRKHSLPGILAQPLLPLTKLGNQELRPLGPLKFIP